MVEQNAPVTTDPEPGTPEVGARQALRQALATVVTLQNASGAHVTAMIPGAWSPRGASVPASKAEGP